MEKETEGGRERDRQNIFDISNSGEVSDRKRTSALLWKYFHIAPKVSALMTG